MKPLPILHLNGFPGTGKLTIAEKLATRLNGFIRELASQTTPTEEDGETTSPAPSKVARLVHNHLLIDPANAVLDRTQPGYQTLRKALRDAVFDTLVREPSTHDALYIFTDWQSGDEIGSRVCKDFQDMARARGSDFVPVLIVCEEEENARRLTSADRSRFSKITDVDLLLRFRKRQGTTASVFEYEGLEHRIVVDVTQLSAGDAAEAIFEHILPLVVGSTGETVVTH